MKKFLIVYILCFVGSPAFSQDDRYPLIDEKPLYYIPEADSSYYDSFINQFYTRIALKGCCEMQDGVEAYSYEYVFREELGVFPGQYFIGGGFNPPIINIGEIYKDMLENDSKYFVDDLMKKLNRAYGRNLKKFTKSCYDFQPVVQEVKHIEENMLLFVVDFHFTVHFQR